ncbi:unnamed protein product [Closterium sp. NIES-65]|nr:unnamed protein product [Closterium sp. NIES-65]
MVSRRHYKAAAEAATTATVRQEGQVGGGEERGQHSQQQEVQQGQGEAGEWVEERGQQGQQRMASKGRVWRGGDRARVRGGWVWGEEMGGGRSFLPLVSSSLSFPLSTFPSTLLFFSASSLLITYG